MLPLKTYSKPQCDCIRWLRFQTFQWIIKLKAKTFHLHLIIRLQCWFDLCVLEMFLQDSEQRTFIYIKGCVPQFEKWLQDNLTVVAGIFIGIALLQVRKSLLLNLISVNFLWTWQPDNLIWSLVRFLLQIFGICLAQNLVSDIEAVRESWWVSTVCSFYFNFTYDHQWSSRKASPTWPSCMILLWDRYSEAELPVHLSTFSQSCVHVLLCICAFYILILLHLFFNLPCVFVQFVYLRPPQCLQRQEGCTR